MSTPVQRRRKARMREVIELRRKGFSQRAIAAHLGIAHQTVQRDLRDYEAAEISQFLAEISHENQPQKGQSR